MLVAEENILNELEREVGRLDARMEAVEEQLRAMRSDVREIRDALVKARGGWLLLGTIIALATSLGALANAYIPHLMPHNP